MPNVSKRRSLSRNMQVIWLGVLALLVVALAACASAPNATSPDPVEAAPTAKPAPTALVIGDSQANAGNDVPTSASWVSQGLSRAGYTPRIEGYGGTGFLKGRPQDGHPSYLESLKTNMYDMPEKNVGLVVVQGGGNDLKYPDGRIEAAASDTVEILKSKYPGVPFAVVSPLNQSGDPASRRIGVSKILATVADQQDAAFIDATGWVAENRLARYLYEDGLHLNPDGHNLMAPVFAKALHDAGLAAVAPARER
jgi:lysophospholipase L1-like esterase